MPELPKRRRGEATTDSEKKETLPTGKTGWGALAARKAALKEKGDFEDTIREFWLKDGETAVVQFITAEPYCMEGHAIKFDGGKWGFTPCQLSHQKHCLVCREGIKKTWKAAFKILDYRGTWDVDKKKFKKDTKVEKVWYVGTKLAEQIQTIIEKRGKDLTTMVFEVTRSGGGKDTTYNLEQAWDEENDRKVIPIEYAEHKYGALEDICKPLSDEALEAKGFTGE